MSPARRTLIFCLAWLLFGALMIWVSVQDFQRGGGTSLWQPVVWEGSSNLVGGLLLMLQRRVTRPYDHLINTPWRWLGVQAICLPMFCVLFVPLVFGLRHIVYALKNSTYTHAPWSELVVYESVKLSVFYGMLVLILFGVLSYQQLLQEKLNSERGTALLRQAQLQQLTQQMQPHFLFNALNTISSLIHAHPERADATLIQLADLLRANLAQGQHTQVTLESELKLLRAYAGVMAERYVGRVALEWHIDDSLGATQVPRMCLQPLLENVFKHTVENRRDLTRIVITACRDSGAQGNNNRALLGVTDDKSQFTAEFTAALTDTTATTCVAPPSAPSSATLAAAPATLSVAMAAGSGLNPDAMPGIGLANLRQRLAALHGDRASLTLTPLSPAGLHAQITLPCAS